MVTARSHFGEARHDAGAVDGQSQDLQPPPDLALT